MPGLIRRRWDIVVLAAIVVAGGWLRFAQLDLMEFGGDHLHTHVLAVKAASGQLPLTGIQSSVGIHNPAMTVYLFSIPALFTKDPVLFGWLPAGLGTAAIALGYLLARRWVSKGAALLGMLLFAVSPWAIVESRKIWAPDLPPFLAVAFILCVVGWLREGRPGYVIGAMVMLAMLNQIHYSTAPLWAIVVLAAQQGYRKGLWKAYAGGGAVYLAMWTPFIVFLALGGYREFGQAQLGPGVERSFLQNISESGLWLARLADHGGLANSFKLPKDAFAGAGDGVWLTALFGVLAACGAAAALARMRRQADLWVIVLWLALPGVVLSFHAVHCHYFIACYPAVFILIGIAADTAWEAIVKRGALQWAAGIAIGVASCAVVAVAAVEVNFYRRFLEVIASGGGAEWARGAVYREKLKVAQYLAREAGGGRFVIVELAHHPSERSYEYLYELAGGEGEVLKRDEGLSEGLPVYLIYGPGRKGDIDTAEAKLAATGYRRVSAKEDVLTVERWEARTDRAADSPSRKAAAAKPTQTDPN